MTHRQFITMILVAAMSLTGMKATARLAETPDATPHATAHFTETAAAREG
jgi:hypothetical protein